MEEAAGAAGQIDNAEARRQRKRAYNAEWNRAKRDQGLCTQCGRPNHATGTKCDACAEKARVYARQQYAKRVAGRERAPQRSTDASANLFCPHCGGNDLARAGHAPHSGEQRYRCRACSRQSLGRNPAPRIDPSEDRRCPNLDCGGRCMKNGKDRNGRQKYICRTCGRGNIALCPSDARCLSGPFPHRTTLYLSPRAAHVLDAYVQKHRMSPAQAVRTIFGRWADEPRVAAAAVDARGNPIGPPRKVEPREDVHTRLADMRSPATIERWRLGGDRRYTTVAVTWKLSVALDDTAKQGLLRFMRKTGLGHQDAARAMIVAAKP